MGANVWSPVHSSDPLVSSNPHNFTVGPVGRPKCVTDFFGNTIWTNPSLRKYGQYTSRWSAIDSTHRWEDGKDKEKNQPAAAQICSTNSTWGALWSSTDSNEDIVGRILYIFYFMLAYYPKDCSCPSFIYFQPTFEICMKTIGGDSVGERIATLVRLLSQVVNLGASSGSTTASEFPNLHPKVISVRLCWGLHMTD